MGYDSATSIERLEFDFSSVDGPKGVIPEPSGEAVETFRSHLRDLFAGRSLDQIMGSGEEEAKDLNDKLAAAVVELCQNHPTREQLDALPPRHRAGFCRYVIKELLDPTPQNPVTRALPAASNGVASPI